MSHMTNYPLSSSEAAKLLGVSDETVRRWADEGKVRHLRLPSGHRRFNEHDLQHLKPVVVEPTEAAS